MDSFRFNLAFAVLVIIALFALALLTTSCASKSAVHFSEKDVAKVHIDLKTCKVYPNQPDPICKARVVLATVPAK
jgi:hypothetical protein